MVSPTAPAGHGEQGWVSSLGTGLPKQVAVGGEYLQGPKRVRQLGAELYVDVGGLIPGAKEQRGKWSVGLAEGRAQRPLGWGWKLGVRAWGLREQGLWDPARHTQEGTRQGIGPRPLRPGLT